MIATAAADSTATQSASGEGTARKQARFIRCRRRTLLAALSAATASGDPSIVLLISAIGAPLPLTVFAMAGIATLT